MQFYSLLAFHVGEGNGNPPQYSRLNNPVDRGAWQATFHGVQEFDTTQRLNHQPPAFIYIVLIL